MKISATLAICLFTIISLTAQDYDISKDLDRDGIVDSDDKDPFDRNVPYDSIFEYTFCSNEKAFVDLWMLYPGLEMRWDSCSAYDSHIGYGKRFTAEPDVMYYSTLYDTISDTPIRRLAHKINIGNENLTLSIDKMEAYKIQRKKKGAKITLHDVFDDYSWEFDDKFHGDYLMHIATFFESGKVRAIGYDKYKCPDTLEFDVDLESFYKEPNTDKRQAQFKPIFQPFSDLSSAKGNIDMRQLTGVYDGAYTYFIETISDGPEVEFKEIGAYHKIQFDSDSNKGYWKYMGNQMLVEHHKNVDSYEIHINDNGKIWKAQIIKLDDTILRLFYAETENQKIVEYYKVR